MSPGDTPKLSVKQAAERAGVSVKTVRRAIDRGDLPAYRPGGTRTLVLLETDVDGWLFNPVDPAERPEVAEPRPARRAPTQTTVGSVTRLRAIERGTG